MAGHSAYSNIMHRKGRQDAKRAKVFTKIGREITVAAKLGSPSPEFNPRLRAAIIEARKNSMPNDRIKRAIDSAIGGGDANNYEETRYEGFGPGGVSIIVDCLTDNRTRTSNEVRTIFNKRGGNMGESGSVAYMFDRVGLLEYPKDKASDDAMFEAALNAGADNVDSSGAVHEITCKPDDFADVRDALAKAYGDADKAALAWKPNLHVDVTDEEQAKSLIGLIEALEDNDDVQTVTANFNITEEILEKIAA